MAKVKVLDVHPTKPWLATADEHDRVVVWDYARHDVLRHLRPNGFGAGADGGGGAPAFGAVRALRWYDADTLWWSARCHGGGDGGGAASALCCLIVQGDHEVQLHHLLTGETTHIAASSGGAGAGGTSSGSSAAAAAGSSKVSFTCVEPVSAALLAIGCSDGAIRVWDWARDACVRALRTHKDRVAVTHLVSAHPDAAWEPRAERAPRLRLVSRGDDGALLLWDMPHAALLSGAAPAAAATDSKSGAAAAAGAVPLEKRRDDKDCATLSYCATTDTLTALLARRRAGQANEMHLSSWDLAARSGGGGGSGGAAVPLAARGKVSRSKGGVAHACVDHAALPQGAIAACGRDARVHIMAMLGGGGGGGGGVAADLDGADAADDPSQSSPYAVVAALPLTALVSGLPEKLKLYALAAHPLRRHLLFVGSNVGAFVLALSRAGAAGDAAAAAPATHCVHPAWGPTTLLGLARGGGGGGAGGGELAKYVVSWGEDRGGRALREEAAPGGALRSRSVTNDSTGRLSDDNGGSGSGGGDAAAAALAAAGDKLLPDGSGRYVAAVLRAAREYRIMTFIEGETALLESGQCLDFAWIGTSTAAGATDDSGAGGSGAAFALLVDINAAAARRERAKAAGGSGLSPRSAAQFVPEIPALSIRRIASGSSGGGDVVSEVGIVDLADGALPVRLHGSGGPLLCLHVREPGKASPSRAAAAAAAATVSPAMTSALSPVPASGGAAAAPGAPKPMFAGLTLAPTVAALPGAQCRFYRWDGGGDGSGSGARTAQPVGASFMATCVAWDAAGTRCAVARGAEVRLLSLTRGGSGGGGSLRRAGGFTLAPAEPVEALAWVAGSLFVTTPASVWVATISGGMGGSSSGGGGAAHVELMKLAANDALAPPPARGWPRGHARPVPVCRPVGALAVLGLFKGGLLVRSARGGCSIIPLDQACLRVALLAGAGRGADAAAVAANALVRSAHDDAAVLLMRAGHTACALDLPGLSAAAAAELLAYGGGGDGGGSSGSGREGDEGNEDAIAAAADALSTRQRCEVLVDATGGCCCSELPGAAAAPLLLRKGLADGDALLARLLASLAAQQ